MLQVLCDLLSKTLLDGRDVWLDTQFFLVLSPILIGLGFQAIQSSNQIGLKPMSYVTSSDFPKQLSNFHLLPNKWFLFKIHHQIGWVRSTIYNLTIEIFDFVGLGKNIIYDQNQVDWTLVIISIFYIFLEKKGSSKFLNAIQLIWIIYLSISDNLIFCILDI